MQVELVICDRNFHFRGNDKNSVIPNSDRGSTTTGILDSVSPDTSGCSIYYPIELRSLGIYRQSTE